MRLLQLVNINLLMSLLKALLIGCVLLCSSMTTALEYQSYGEFTRTQLSQIIEVVQKTLNSGNANKAKVISDELNGMMDSAWYVIYMDKSNNYDNIMVLYGYAFKNHWMWLSNFVEGKSVVLWKDYNCDTWADRVATNFAASALPFPNALKFDPNALEYDGLNSLRLFAEVSPEYLGETWKLIFDITTALNNNQNAYAYTGFSVQIPIESDFTMPEFSYCLCKKAEKYETLLLFQVKIKDYREEVTAPAGKAFVMLMRTR